MTEQKPFRVEVVVGAPREAVWRALSEPERVATVTTYGLDEGAFEALRQRWESWWAGLTRDVAA